MDMIDRAMGLRAFQKLPKEAQESLKHEIDQKAIAIVRRTGASMTEASHQVAKELGVSLTVVQLVTQSKAWLEKMRWARRI